MTTSQQVIDLAAMQVGEREAPDGSNHTIYNQWYGMDRQPWCGMFVSWVMAHNGLDVIHYAYTPTGAANFKSGAWGQWLPKDAPVERGDVVFYQWSGSPRICHTGLVAQGRADGRFDTIEGNVSNSVKRLVRSRAYVAGFGRPMYSPDGLPPTPQQPPTPVPNMGGRLLSYVHGKPMLRGADVYALQQVLHDLTGKPDRVDGVFGPATAGAVVDFQRWDTLVPDGVAGPKTKALLAYLHARRAT